MEEASDGRMEEQRQKAPPKKKDRRDLLKALIAAFVKHVKRLQKGDKKLDCADVALTALAYAAFEVGVNIKLWYLKNGKWVSFDSSASPNAEAYAKKLRVNLGAINLIDRQNTSPRAYEDLQPGDLILFDLREHKDPDYMGHTMIVVKNDPENKKVTVIEGHTSGKIEVKTYTYAKLENLFHERHTDDKRPIPPVDNKGRTWNWKKVLAD